MSSPPPTSDEPSNTPMFENPFTTPIDIAALLASLTIWFGAYYITVLSPKTGTPNGFESSTFLSNLHSVPLVILAMASLWEIVPETFPLSWCLSFFVVDTVDCVSRRDLMWSIHALISLALNLLTGMHGVHRTLRSVSKGFFAEASTPFLNYWKKTKTKQDFVVFFISFTLCRIIWVPYFVYSTYAIHLKGKIDFLIYPSIAFLLLQFAWYSKMCVVVANYKESVVDDVNGKSGEKKEDAAKPNKVPGRKYRSQKED